MYYASDFRRIAREALSNNWGLAIITGLVAGLLGGGSGGSSSGSSGYQSSRGYSELASTEYGRVFLGFFVGFASLIFVYGVVVFIFGSAIQLGYIRFNRNLLDRRNAGFTDIFSKFNMFGRAFLLRLLMTIFTFLWTLLLIIPGIIAAYSYAMAPYILEENPGMTATEAIACSKEMMRGNKWRLFCLQISFIGWVILCLFTCGIGFLWLSPYMYMAEVAFFYDVSGKFNAPNGQFQQNGSYNQYNPYQQNGYQQGGYQQGGYQQGGFQQNGYQPNGYQQEPDQPGQYQQNENQQNPSGSMPSVSEQPGQDNMGNPANPADSNDTANQ